MIEGPTSAALSDAGTGTRPPPGDADIYRALVGRGTELSRPLGAAWANTLRGWRHSPWFEATLARMVRRAREGADRLAR